MTRVPHATANLVGPVVLIVLSACLQGCFVADAFRQLAAVCANDEFIVVTTSQDYSNRGYCDGRNQCTLRRALRTANFCSYDGVKTVRFDIASGADTFTLRRAAPDDPMVSGRYRVRVGDVGLPRITGRVIVEGGGITIERDASASAFRLVHVVPDAQLTLRNVALRNGQTVDSAEPRDLARGGAINNGGNLILEDSTITGSEARVGGAIYNSGTLSVRRSVLTENRALSYGSAIFSSHGATALVSRSRLSANRHDWGAVHTEGTLDLLQSTLDGNVGRYAGGLSIGTQPGSTTITRVVNSTFSGNSGQTGAVWCDDPGRAADWLLELRDVTAAYNSATDAGWTGVDVIGGIQTFACPELRISNTIVANNSPKDCGNNRAVIEATSLDSDNTCEGFTLHADSNLGALRDNGGSTPTRLPNAGSPVINAGSACEAVDQRDAPRSDLRCDIGSVEIPVIPPLETPVAPIDRRVVPLEDK